MNILIPNSWLQKHLDTNAKPEDIQRCLSLCGPSVERIYEREGDFVYEVEVTTNRVDSASVRGIAREAAVILPEFGFSASLKPLKTIDLSLPGCIPLDIDIQNDHQLCHRIITIKLSNIKLGQSPAWLQKQLRLIDLKPNNNAIDITNYIMWDIGHPIHAFDYDQITSRKIIVRNAKPGEKFVTLDDKSHICHGGEVVFDDGTGKIIDLPGIMGTKNTSVNHATKNILLWIESVDAVKIRQASMGLAIRSQAAVLNEKQVDPELAPLALNQAVQLFKSIAGASVKSCVFDIYPKPISIQPTQLSQHQINTYLGLSIASKRVAAILEGLGCLVEVIKGKDSSSLPTYKITPPSFRLNDLAIPEDYIEEIARIYGYHNLPATIMPTPIPYHPPEEDFHFEQQVKQWLTGWGISEIYSYSMVSKDLAKMSDAALSAHLEITNPLSDEWVYMRRTLIPSMQQVITNNSGRNITLFEMQNIYLQEGDNLPIEELHLTILSNHSYKYLKGILDALMLKCHLHDYIISPIDPTKPFLSNQTGSIESGKTKLGTIGAVGQKMYAIDLVMMHLQNKAKSHPSKIVIPSFPPIIEDLTFTLPQKTNIGPIIKAIKSLDTKIVEVLLKDIYHQNYTLTLKYRSSETSLSSEDVSPLRQEVVDQMYKKYQAKLVGQLQS